MSVKTPKQAITQLLMFASEAAADTASLIAHPLLALSLTGLAAPGHCDWPDSATWLSAAIPHPECALSSHIGRAPSFLGDFEV